MLQNNSDLSRESSAKPRSKINSAKIPALKIKQDVLKKFYFFKDISFDKRSQIKKKHENFDNKKTMDDVNFIVSKHKNNEFYRELKSEITKSKFNLYQPTTDDEEIDDMSAEIGQADNVLTDLYSQLSDYDDSKIKLLTKRITPLSNNDNGNDTYRTPVNISKIEENNDKALRSVLGKLSSKAKFELMQKFDTDRIKNKANLILHDSTNIALDQTNAPKSFSDAYMFQLKKKSTYNLNKQNSSSLTERELSKPINEASLDLGLAGSYSFRSNFQTKNHNQSFQNNSGVFALKNKNCENNRLPNILNFDDNQENSLLVKEGAGNITEKMKILCNSHSKSRDRLINTDREYIEKERIIEEMKGNTRSMEHKPKKEGFPSLKYGVFPITSMYYNQKNMKAQKSKKYYQVSLDKTIDKQNNSKIFSHVKTNHYHPGNNSSLQLKTEKQLMGLINDINPSLKNLAIKSGQLPKKIKQGLNFNSKKISLTKSIVSSIDNQKGILIDSYNEISVTRLNHISNDKTETQGNSNTELSSPNFNASTEKVKDDVKSYSPEKSNFTKNETCTDQNRNQTDSNQYPKKKILSRKAASRLNLQIGKQSSKYMSLYFTSDKISNPNKIDIPLRNAYYMNKLYSALNTKNCDYILSLAKEQSKEFYHTLNAMAHTNFDHEEQKKNLDVYKNGVVSSKRLLVLDMDETLIHCKALNGMVIPDNPSNSTSDRIISIKLNDNIELGIFVHFRPHVFEFLKTMSEFYDIVVFTASSRQYATPILEILDPEKKYIKGTFFREHCIKADNKSYIKDLRMFSKQKNQNDIVIVDNSANCFSNNLSNAIPVIPFYGNKIDKELPELQKFLMWLQEKQNIPKIQKNYFRLHSYIEGKVYDEAINNIFGGLTS